MLVLVVTAGLAVVLGILAVNYFGNLFAIEAVGIQITLEGKSTIYPVTIPSFHQLRDGLEFVYSFISSEGDASYERFEESESGASKSADESYDVIFRNLDNVSSVLENGVEVSISSSLMYSSWKEMDEKHFKGAIVVVRGLYDRGKSWFFHRLCNIPLPKGDYQSTDSISIVVSKGHMPLTLVDTAGSAVPVKNLTVTSLVDSRIGETLIDDVAFNLGDYYVLVVGQLTSNDQEELLHLVRQMKVLHLMQKRNIRKEFILIHNLRGVRLVDVPNYFENRISKTFPDRTCENFTSIEEKDAARLKTIPVSQKIICKQGEGGYGFGQFSLSSEVDGVTVYHYFLVDEHFSNARFLNNVTLKSLRKFINLKLPPSIFHSPYQVISNITKILRSRLPLYVARVNISSSDSETDLSSVRVIDDQLPEPIEIETETETESARVCKLKLKLKGCFTVRQKLYNSFTIDRLPSPAPDVPFTSYDRLTEKNGVVSMLYQLEIPGLQNNDTVVVSPRKESNWAVVKVMKQSPRLGFNHSTDALVQVNNDVKNGLISFIIPVKFQWRRAATCVNFGILTVIFNFDELQDYEMMQCPIDNVFLFEARETDGRKKSKYSVAAASSQEAGVRWQLSRAEQQGAEYIYQG